MRTEEKNPYIGCGLDRLCSDRITQKLPAVKVAPPVEEDCNATTIAVTIVVALKNTDQRSNFLDKQ